MNRITITAEQRDFFWRNGFLILDQQPLVEEETVSKLHERFKRCFRGEFSTKQYPDEWHWREGISKPDAVREICNGWKSDELIRSVVLAEEVGHIGSQLFEHWRSVRIGQDDLIWKLPAGEASSEQVAQDSTRQVGYHVDGTYISDQFTNASAGNALTVWIALDDADEETGVVEYISGSHLLPAPLLATATQSFHANASPSGKDGSIAKLKEELLKLPASAMEGKPKPTLDLVQPRIPKGCCVVHHQSTLHGSRANRSTTRHRRALVSHIIDGDSRFVEHPDYIYGRYKLRDTDELREEFFPTIWRKTEGDDSKRVRRNAD